MEPGSQSTRILLFACGAWHVLGDGNQRKNNKQLGMDVQPYSNTALIVPDCGINAQRRQRTRVLGLASRLSVEHTKMVMACCGVAPDDYTVDHTYLGRGNIPTLVPLVVPSRTHVGDLPS